jgi:hypothetical protein
MELQVGILKTNRPAPEMRSNSRIRGPPLRDGLDTAHADYAVALRERAPLEADGTTCPSKPRSRSSVQFLSRCSSTEIAGRVYVSPQASSCCPTSAIAIGSRSPTFKAATCLGIAIERIRPGNPQDNGRHERMHLTLKAETTQPAVDNFLRPFRRFCRPKPQFPGERDPALVCHGPRGAFRWRQCLGEAREGPWLASFGSGTSRRRPSSC